MPVGQSLLSLLGDFGAVLQYKLQYKIGNNPPNGYEMHSFGSDILLLNSEEKACGDYLSGLYSEIRELGAGL